VFTAADFELYTPAFWSDPDWNARRLEIRHRLQALGERVREGYRDRFGIELERRESLHHPHASNRKRVVRQRTMLFRGKADRKVLQRFLGPELAKDLDSAYRNVHLEAGIEHSGTFWGLKLLPDAWYDLNALKERMATPEGGRALAEAARGAPGFVLTLDGGGARPLETMDERDWRDLAGLLKPGETALEVVARLAPEASVAAGEDWDEGVVADLLRLEPLLRLATWTIDPAKPSF